MTPEVMLQILLCIYRRVKLPPIITLQTRRSLDLLFKKSQLHFLQLAMMSQPRPRKTQQKIVDRESAGSTSAARSEGKRKERDGASTGPGAGTGQLTEMDISSIIAAWRRQPLWMVLAVASGACAAINGVFAKLYVL